MSDRGTMEGGAAAFFTADHRACDALWPAVEAAGEKGDGAALQAAFAAFARAMRRHLDMEEQVLFPAFEKATGMVMGPTRVMRGEHAQMRAVLDQMAAAVPADPAAVLDLGDTLLMLVQQHNRKEEGMLYPMCDAHLGVDWPALAAALAKY
jgi:iron-sulfur cluster repair protein YtfE (RIC family)